MHTDTVLLHTFMALKGQPHEEASEISNKLKEESSIDILRKLAIDEGRIELIKQFLSIEWNEIINKSDMASFIKIIVKNYLMDVPTLDTFIIIYNYIQEYIRDPGDILYFLNPLRFPGYEIAAINTIQIDPSLDYSGFISACRVKCLDSNILHSFIKRLGGNNQLLLNTRKYEKIMARKHKTPCTSSSY